jgi:hypothetical protein
LARLNSLKKWARGHDSPLAQINYNKENYKNKYELVYYFISLVCYDFLLTKYFEFME